MHVQPEEGTLLLWSNCLDDGRSDPLAMHQSVPLQHGEKWILNRFLTASNIPLSECGALEPRISSVEYAL